MSENTTEEMRPDLYNQLPRDTQIVYDGLQQMTRKCEEYKGLLEQAQSVAKEYRDKFCATMITKHESLPWEK